MAKITIHFIEEDGEKVTVSVNPGETLLDVAHKHGIDIPFLCGGSLACSSCHVIVEESFFDKIPSATEDEEDMLDLVFEIKPTSRLGCQIVFTEDLDGATFKIPMPK